MRRIERILLLCAAASLLLAGCGPAKTANAAVPAADIVTITFDFAKQSGYASNQFAVWIEDADGGFVKTLYATRFTANGGYQNRPDSIPLWVERSGLAAASGADAVTGATPKSGPLSYAWDLTGANGERVPDGTYRFFVEGSLRWKNRVLYSGEITIGGGAAVAEAEAQYTYEGSADQPALTGESPENGMLGAVTAAYIPPQQQ